MPLRRPGGGGRLLDGEGHAPSIGGKLQIRRLADIDRLVYGEFVRRLEAGKKEERKGKESHSASLTEFTDK